jgi:hypothetical protein
VAALKPAVVVVEPVVRLPRSAGRAEAAVAEPDLALPRAVQAWGLGAGEVTEVEMVDSIVPAAVVQIDRVVDWIDPVPAAD